MDDIELSVISVIGRIVEEMLEDPAARIRVLNYLAEKYVEPVPEWEPGPGGIGFQSATAPRSMASGWAAYNPSPGP